MSRGTIQVALIKQSAPPEPLVSEIANLSQRIKGHVLYPLQDPQDPVSRGAAGLQGPGTRTLAYWSGNGVGV